VLTVSKLSSSGTMLHNFTAWVLFVQTSLFSAQPDWCTVQSSHMQLLVYTYVNICGASGHNTTITISLSHDATRRCMASSVILHEGKFSTATHIIMSNWLEGDQTCSEKPCHDFTLTASSESVEASSYDALVILGGSQLLLSVSWASYTLIQERV